MRSRILLSSVAAATLLASAPAAFAAEWNVGDEATFYIDATVTHTATPDMLYMAVECSIQKPMSRDGIRAKQKEYLDSLSEIGGTGVRVRRSGAPSLYLSGDYDPSTGMPIETDTPMYAGNFGYSILLRDTANATKLAAAVDELGCTYTWDPRIVQTAKYARENRAELVKQINEKKAFYEELLGVKLNHVSNVSISTYVDSSYGTYYGNASTYDVDENVSTVTTTMSVTFSLPKAKKD